MTWKKKLHPGRFARMSGKMAAIVGFICDERFTRPAITELVITGDGFLLAANEGDTGCNDMLGGESDLRRNWNNLLDAAGLTAEERIQAEGAYRAHVHSFRVLDDPKPEQVPGAQLAKPKQATSLYKG